MSILKNNWHWMLFALTIFGGIGVVLFTQLNTDTEPKTVYKLPSEETLQNIREKSAAQKAQEADGEKRPPPAGETYETGYWHGDHWHRTAPSQKSPQTPKVTADGVVHAPGTLIGNKAFWNKYWKDRGLEPPDGDWTWATDGKGNYYKSYKGQFTPFEIKTKIGYAPTLEQYQQMQKLHAEWHRAKNKGYTAEVQRLEAEMATLREASQGELPTYAGGVYQGRVGESPEEAKRNGRIQRAAVLRQLYREYGLEHLMPLTE